MPKKVWKMICFNAYIEWNDLVLWKRRWEWWEKIKLDSVIHILKFNTIWQRTFWNLFYDHKIQVIYWKWKEEILNFHTDKYERDELFKKLLRYCQKDKDFILNF